jgi:hypothetical protein
LLAGCAKALKLRTSIKQVCKSLFSRCMGLRYCFLLIENCAGAGDSAAASFRDIQRSGSVLFALIHQTRRVCMFIEMAVVPAVRPHPGSNIFLPCAIL